MAASVGELHSIEKVLQRRNIADIDSAINPDERT
jgi:hypothetical protein